MHLSINRSQWSGGNHIPQPRHVQKKSRSSTDLQVLRPPKRQFESQFQPTYDCECAAYHQSSAKLVPPFHVHPRSSHPQSAVRKLGAAWLTVQPFHLSLDLPSLSHLGSPAASLRLTLVVGLVQLAREFGPGDSACEMSVRQSAAGVQRLRFAESMRRD